MSARRIVHRSFGHRHGPVTRLVSPSDWGQLLRPFVFLDHVDTRGVHPSRAGGFGLHPHSGIVTLTWLLQGSVNYEDTTGRKGRLSQGELEWMRAGGGAWHGGSFGDVQPVRGFQLWMALPPAAELGPAQSIYLAPHRIESDGPVTVLLGHHGTAAGAIEPPSPLNYLSVKLKAGQLWRYDPPADHTVAFAAVSVGGLTMPDGLRAGELAIFEASNQGIDFEAETDTEFVLGSAVPHPHPLVLGHYSVHTSAAALHEGEARIAQIGARLRQAGRLG